MEMEVGVVCSGNGFRWRCPGALWLRVVTCQHEQQAASHLPVVHERVVLEAKIAEQSAGTLDRGATWCSKSARVELLDGAARRHGDKEDECTQPSLMLELWAAGSTPGGDSSSGDAHEFISFIGSACVALGQWQEAPLASAIRWYLLTRDPTTSTKETRSSSENSAFEEHEERRLQHAAYFQVTLIDASRHQSKPNARPQAQCSSSSPSIPDFQFSLPNQPVTQNRRFLATRVGEIVYERNTERLRELLPVVLHGNIKLSTTQSRFPTNSQQMRTRCCLNTGLQLLQLSCQYASYCTTKLDESTRCIERRQSKLLQYKANLQHQRRKMELQRRNLSRELQVVTSSLDGMHMLLRQVDPECLARLGKTPTADLQSI